MSGMSLLAGKALSSARMSDILSQTSLTGSQQLHQREESGLLTDMISTPITVIGFFVCLFVCVLLKVVRFPQCVTLKGSCTPQPATPPPAPVTCSSATGPQTCSAAWSRLGSSTGTHTTTTNY